MERWIDDCWTRSKSRASPYVVSDVVAELDRGDPIALWEALMVRGVLPTDWNDGSTRRYGANQREFIGSTNLRERTRIAESWMDVTLQSLLKVAVAWAVLCEAIERFVAEGEPLRWTIELYLRWVVVLEWGDEWVLAAPLVSCPLPSRSASRARWTGVGGPMRFTAISQRIRPCSSARRPVRCA